MDLYHVILFAHIIGAIVVVGSGFFLPFVAAGAARATALTSFRDWTNVVLQVSKAAGGFAAVILVTGLYMGIRSGRFDEPWLAVSLVLFVLNGALAGGVLGKHWKNVMARAEEAGDGPVPEDIRALTHDAKMHTIESVTLASDLVIVFLMTTKPGWPGTAGSVVVGLVLAGALVARPRRQRQAVTATAS